MEKKEYLIPDLRIRDIFVERSILSALPGDGENANPYEEDW